MSILFLHKSVIVFTIFIFLRAQCLIMKMTRQSYNGALAIPGVQIRPPENLDFIRIGRHDGNDLRK